MELLLISSFLVGVWMNWSFAVCSKPKWNDLYALRNLVGFQLTADLCNILTHLLLLLPWPLWGYIINPGNYLWTVNPLICRLFMVVEETISISCAANATCIFWTNVEKHDLKQERKRKIAWCMVLVTLLLGGLFAVVYTELIPLLNYRDMNVSNCPLHPLSILGDQKELKYVFVGYVGCSAIIFWSTDDKSKSHFREEKPNNSVHTLVKVLFIVCYYSTIFALVFAIICIPINFLGGSLYSVTFNKVKLCFDIIILAVSIILPALLAHIHASENTGNRGYSMELSRTERMPGLEQRHIKIGMNNNGKKT